jgi:tetratricopeptide (TPR) repeat protein
MTTPATPSTCTRPSAIRSARQRALNGIGWFQARLGSYQAALASCDKALALCQLGEDRRGEASTQDSLGYIHHQLGDFTQAIACYQRALVSFEELGASHNLASVLLHLGDTYQAADHTDSAQAARQQARQILDDLSLPAPITNRP